MAALMNHVLELLMPRVPSFAKARALEAEKKLEALNDEITKEKAALLDNVRAQERKLQDQIDALEKQGLHGAEEALQLQKQALQKDRDAIERLGDGHDDVGGDAKTGPAQTPSGKWAEPFQRRVEAWVSDVEAEVGVAARDLLEDCARVLRAHEEDVRLQSGRSARQRALLSAQSGATGRQQVVVKEFLERLSEVEVVVGCAIQGMNMDLDHAAAEALRILSERVSESSAAGLEPPGSDPALEGVVQYFSTSGAREVLQQLLRAAKAKVLCGVAELSRELRSVILGCSPGVVNGLLAVTRRVATVCTNWELALAQVDLSLGFTLQAEVSLEQGPDSQTSEIAAPLGTAELESVAMRALESLEEDLGVLVEELCASQNSKTEELEMEGLAQLIAAASEWLVQLALAARARASSVGERSEPEEGHESVGIVGVSDASPEDKETCILRVDHLERILSRWVTALGRRVSAVALAGGRSDLASSIEAVTQASVLEMGFAFDLITGLGHALDEPMGGPGISEQDASAKTVRSLVSEDGVDEQVPRVVSMFGRPVYPLELPEFRNYLATHDEMEFETISQGTS
jgi:hypothetical protein